MRKTKMTQLCARIAWALLLASGAPTFAQDAGACLDLVHRAQDQAKHKENQRALLTYFEALHCNPNVIEGQFSGRLEPFAPAGPERNAWKKGDRVTGRAILVYAVKGNGDSLQFSRFLKDLVKAGPKRVYFAVPKALKTLMAESFRGDPVIEVRELDEVEDLAKAVDLHAPLLSLPFLLSVTEISDLPYLGTKRSMPLELDPKTINVGVVLSGDPKHPHNRDRSFTKQDLKPLVELKRFKFYSLQPGSADLSADTGQGPAVSTELLGKIGDYADTAAIIKQLDVVVSADTSVSHLAAALGQPTFVPLPFRPDLRYAGQGSKTEWYRDMVLLRQTKPGDWQKPIKDLAQRLAQVKKASR